MNPAGVEEDTLGKGGLAGVNVRHDAYVAHFVQRELTSQDRTSKLPRIFCLNTHHTLRTNTLGLLGEGEKPLSRDSAAVSFYV
jgi:hypothetical protein